MKTCGSNHLTPMPSHEKLERSHEQIYEGSRLCAGREDKGGRILEGQECGGGNVTRRNL